MIQIIKQIQSCKSVKQNHDYSLYVNKTHQIDFAHFREPEDLAQLLRDAADAIDLSNNITPPHLVSVTPKQKTKLSMMERMNGIQHHLEKQGMGY